MRFCWDGRKKKDLKYECFLCWMVRREEIKRKLNLLIYMLSNFDLLIGGYINMTIAHISN